MIHRIDMPRPGEVGVTGWHGTTWHRVNVIGETKTRYRIVATQDMKLPRREVPKGGIALVPKRAVRFQD